MLGAAPMLHTLCLHLDPMKNDAGSKKGEKKLYVYSNCCVPVPVGVATRNRASNSNQRLMVKYINEFFHSLPINSLRFTLSDPQSPARGIAVSSDDRTRIAHALPLHQATVELCSEHQGGTSIHSIHELCPGICSLIFTFHFCLFILLLVYCCHLQRFHASIELTKCTVCVNICLQYV